MLLSDATPTLYDCVELYGMDLDAYLSDYPIWDEGKRDWLNARIKDHFLYRQIAQDTPAKHGYYLRRTMHDMMASVNPMFAALDRENDILKGFAQEQTVTSSANQTFSALPQSRLSSKDDYATNSTDNTSDASTRISGRTQSIGAALTEWASSVNNALYIVYNGLEPLYMQVLPVSDWEEDYNYDYE